MYRPLSDYVSCSPPSNWAVAEGVVIAGSLMMRGHDSGIFSTYVSRSSTRNMSYLKSVSLEFNLDPF
jgi:hypothetical protein